MSGPLIRVKSVVALPLQELERLVLEYVYEYDRMPMTRFRQMEDGMDTWNRKLDLDQTMDRLDEVERNRVKIMHQLIQHRDARHPRLMQRIALFKEWGIDWRKFHRLPEAYTPKDFARGKAIGEESDRREGIA